MFNFYPKNLLLLLLLAIPTIVAYYSGLADGFYFDDHINIVDNVLLHVESPTLANFWQAAWSGNSGPIGRPLSYLSFSLNWYFTGDSAYAMKLTNLGIHLAVGILLFILSRQLLAFTNQSNSSKLQINVVSFLVALTWLLHPINLTSVLYVVQRMTSLSALFCVCVMLCYTHYRIQQMSLKGQWLPFIVFVIIFGLLALLAKETAAIVIFYLASIEFFIFRFQTLNKLDEIILKSLYALVFLSLMLGFSIFFYTNPDWLKNIYELRSFSLSERLLTESRIIIWYLKMIVAPNISEMSLFLDDFALSKSLFQPITTILSTIIIALLLVGGLIFRKKFILISFGIFWFFSAHLLESTILPLELAYEHRNYLPSFGIIICFVSIFNQLISRKKIKYVVTILLATWISLISYTTFLRAHQWSDPLQLALADIEYHPNSARAHTTLAGIYASIYAGFDAGIVTNSDALDGDDVFSKADYHFKKSVELDPFFSSANVARLILYSSYDKDISNIEFDKIIHSLKNKKIDSSTVSALKKLSDCQINKVCKLTTKDFMAVMYAPISKKDIDKEHLALLLIFLSEYYVAVLNDLETAINLTKIAIEERPKDIHYRFILVRWLVASNDYQQALNEIEKIRTKDRLGMFTSNSNKWTKQIEKSSKQTL